MDYIPCKINTLYVTEAVLLLKHQAAGNVDRSFPALTLFKNNLCEDFFFSVIRTILCEDVIIVSASAHTAVPNIRERLSYASLTPIHLDLRSPVSPSSAFYHHRINFQNLNFSASNSKMLILITGITGMVGLPCAKAALARGHSVRGLGRNREKVPEDILQQLENFVQYTGIYDIPALDRAVKGVDAIICAYTYAPEVVIEGQLLLLRAAERAGIKIFHAASWNYDWTKGELGQHESYDPYIAFANHVRLSSSIKPIYMFTGIIVEWFFENPRGSSWNRETKTLSYFGDETKPLICCTADDIAAYSVEAVAAPGAENGGFVRVDSFRVTPEQIAREYEAARGGGVKAHVKRLGSLEDVEMMLTKARKEIDPTEFEKYIGLSYVDHMLKGTWDYESVDVKRFGNVKQTSLKEWFEMHPEL